MCFYSDINTNIKCSLLLDKHCLTGMKAEVLAQAKWFLGPFFRSQIQFPILYLKAKPSFMLNNIHATNKL